MLAFPGMIAESAKKAGIAVPADPDGEWDANEFPHFAVFCNAQLGRPMLSPGEHWDNAEAIARIPAEKIKTATLNDLIEAGFSVTL